MGDPTTATPILRPCQVCGKDGGKACSRCKDYPSRDLVTPQSVYYCSRDCQKRDWANHKKHCWSAVVRKMLIDITLQLQDWSYDWIQLSCATFRVKAVKREGKHLTADLYHPIDLEIIKETRVWGPIDGGVQCSEEEKRDILMTGSCIVVSNLFGGLIATVCRSMFVNAPDCVQLVTCHLKDPPRTYSKQTRLDEESNLHLNHDLIRCRLFNDEEIAIDLTSIQFGFEATITPWDKYTRDHVDRVLHIQNVLNPTKLGGLAAGPEGLGNEMLAKATAKCRLVIIRDCIVWASTHQLPKPLNIINVGNEQALHAWLQQFGQVLNRIAEPATLALNKVILEYNQKCSTLSEALELGPIAHPLLGVELIEKMIQDGVIPDHR